LEGNVGNNHFGNNSAAFESEEELKESDYLEQIEEYNQQLHFKNLEDQKNCQEKLKTNR